MALISGLYDFLVPDSVLFSASRPLLLIVKCSTTNTVVLLYSFTAKESLSSAVNEGVYIQYIPEWLLGNRMVPGSIASSLVPKRP